jgi:hypothetical protein
MALQGPSLGQADLIVSNQHHAHLKDYLKGKVKALTSTAKQVRKVYY